MALSFDAVTKAYKVFNELGLEHIQSFPPDFNELEDWEKMNPREQWTYGIDQKFDNGWEQLFFFIKKPSHEFIENWKKLKDSVPNSSFMHKYKENQEYTMFGWF